MHKTLSAGAGHSTLPGKTPAAENKQLPRRARRLGACEQTTRAMQERGQRHTRAREQSAQGSSTEGEETAHGEGGVDEQRGEEGNAGRKTR